MKAAPRLLWALLSAAALAAPAAAGAEEPGSEAAAAKSQISDRAADPISLLTGSADAWSVSNGEYGCYLLSAYRDRSSRLAIGRHPSFGLGLFAVGFGLATNGINAEEAIGIQTGPDSMVKPGRMVAAKVLFVPLTPAEVDASLQELGRAGTLWISVRTGAIAHGGMQIQPAIAEYRRTCADPVAH